MFFFMLLNIIMGYFLSLNDFRFVGYLVFFALLQFILIVLFHASLLQVAAVLCLNSAIAFLSHLVLLGRKGRPSF
jgi:hypothetical protein